MPIRFKKGSPRRHHFIAEWRRHRQLSQAALGAELGISKASVSRIERCVQPYTQDILEAIADVLGAEPATLLSYKPEESETLFSVWKRIPKSGRRQALAVLQALACFEPDK
jgi:transcriptional regulator with XRE-family HTH domain